MYKPPQRELPKLEPFPFTPDTAEQNHVPKIKVPLPSQPSKFVPGKTRESDYESDLDGGIPVKWKPRGGSLPNETYRSVSPHVQSSGARPQKEHRKTPTPPMQFEEPLVSDGQLRPDIDFDQTLHEISQSKKFLNNKSSASNSIMKGMEISQESQSSSFYSTQMTTSFNSGYTSDPSMTTSNTSTLDRSLPMGQGQRRGTWTSDTSPPSLEPVTYQSSVSNDKRYTSNKSCHTFKAASSSSCTQELVSDSEYDDGTLKKEMIRFKKVQGNNSRSPRQTPDQGGPQPNTTTKRPDGYEADTDDTLRRKRKSVKELALSFQEAENACPTQLPFMPRGYMSESDYESEAEVLRSRSRLSKTPDPVFTQSRAYVPPKWTPMATVATPSEAKESKQSMQVVEQDQFGQRTVSMQQQTKVIRFNQQNVVKSETAESQQSASKHVFSLPTATTTTTVESLNPHETASSLVNEEFVNKMKDQVANETADAGPKKVIPVFMPKKFVPAPRSHGPEESASSWTMAKSSPGDKLRPKWAPSDSETDEPCYRKISSSRPSAPAQKHSDGSVSVQSEFKVSKSSGLHYIAFLLVSGFFPHQCKKFS